MITPAWSSCKKKKLCKTVDRSLVRRFHENGRREGVEFYEQKSREIEKGMIAAEGWLRRHGVPSNPDDFIEALRKTHSLLFDEADRSIAGRIRTQHDSIEFGGEGQHRLQGILYSDIEPRLRELFIKDFGRTINSDDNRTFIRYGARFLEKFFRIHPFVDGNGRIARMFIRAATYGKDFEIDFEAQPVRGHDKAKYLKAFEYAHKHVPDSEHPDKRKVTNPYRGIERWLEKHYRERPLEANQVEANPPVANVDDARGERSVG